MVHQTSDLLSTPRAIAEHRPALVLLVAGKAGDGMPAIVKAIRENGLDSQCLVLVDDAQQQRQALSAGADAALLKGCRATELCKVIETLIAGQQVRRGSLH
jgi:DNA-binding NarL/FixJ family response regulator